VDIPHGYVHVEVSDTGAVIHGARVYLFSETGAYLNRYMETDAFGDASFFIPEGAYKFRVDYDGRQYWSDTVQTIADEALDLPLDIGLLARDQTNDPHPRRYHGTPPKFEPQPVYLASLMSLPGILSQSVVGATPQDAVYYYLNDHLGTPLKVLDESGIVAWQADYESFGCANNITQSFINNFRFPGQYDDHETGMLYNYHRYYDPAIGRYLTPDPIGLEGGINLYAYVNNDPVNFIDPLGLVWKTVSHEHHKTRNILTFLLNRITNIIGKGDNPSFIGADPKEYEWTRRDVIQEWQHDPDNPCRDSEHTIGAQRRITQKYQPIPPRKSNELWDPQKTHYWGPAIPSRTYDGIPEAEIFNNFNWYEPL
jgi:RHS repeat-associated protein